MSLLEDALKKNKKSEPVKESKPEDVSELASIIKRLLNSQKELDRLSGDVIEVKKIRDKLNKAIESVKQIGDSNSDDIDQLRQATERLSTEINSFKDELAGVDSRLGQTIENIKPEPKDIAKEVGVIEAIALKHKQNTDTALGVQSQDLDMGGHQVKQLGDPTDDSDATNKKYVDERARRLAFQSGQGGGSSTLRGLSDVVISSPTDNQPLAYHAATAQWINQTLAGTGDMLEATYDPQAIGGDAFDTDNHTDGSTNGVYTLAERTKLAAIAAGADVTADNAPKAHKTSHQNAGGDEISVAGLSGELADPQPPKSHGSDHADGTDDVTDLVGDSGSGGTHGLVPAPGAGDAAAGKYLKADGVWTTPAGGGDVTGPASSTDNEIARQHSTTGKVLQTYTSNPPTISDTGDVNIDGDLDVENIVVSGTVDGVDIAGLDAAVVKIAALENPPTEDESGKTITSEWAFDHDADVSAHHIKYTDAESVTAVEAAGLQFAENKGITLDAALSADGKYSAIMLKTGTAGTNLSFGQAVYFAVADSKWELAKGDAEATVAPMTGIVVVAGVEDAAVTICVIGEVRADAQFPALTVGAPVFISAAAAGAVTSTELTTGQFQKAIGWATTADSILVTGNPDYVKVG